MDNPFANCSSTLLDIALPVLNCSSVPFIMIGLLCFLKNNVGRNPAAIFLPGKAVQGKICLKFCVAIYWDARKYVLWIMNCIPGQKISNSSRSLHAQNLKELQNLTPECKTPSC